MSEIRRKAEELLKSQKAKLNDYTNLELHQLLEELHVHQVELEIQNEELRAKQQENEIARQKYFNLFEMAPIGYLVIDQQGVILELNLKAAEIFDRRKDFTVNRPFVSLLQSESMSLFYDSFELAQKNHLKSYFELQIHKGNVKRDIDVVISKYIGNEFLVIILDITERKLAENERIESEAKYRNFVQNSMDAFALTDEHGNITEWNRALEEISEVSREEAFGEKVWDIQFNMIKDEYRTEKIYTEIKKSFEKYFETGSGNFLNRILEYELELPTQKKYIHQNSFSIKTPSGFQLGSVSRDFTAQKNAETALKINEEKYRNLIENISDGVYYTDRQGRFMFFNSSFIKMFGYEKEELLGKPAWHLAKKGTEEQTRQRFLEHNQKNDFTPIEVETETKTGEVLFCEISIKRSSSDDYSYGVVRDITTRKMVEANLRKYNDELVLLNLSKDKFFNIIAHDLKNPFNSILGYAELLLETDEIRENGKAFSFVKPIYNSAMRAYKLLENLLDWSRLQQGALIFKPIEIDLTTLVEDILMLFHEQAALKNIALNHFSPYPIKVYADKGMVNTILRNLVSNAIKFSFPDSEIKISILERNQYAEIKVSDKGIGIKPENIENLFIFEKNTSTLGTAKESGTGLGLVLCSEFVGKNGGLIWVESKPNVGTDFIFTLPLVAETTENC